MAGDSGPRTTLRVGTSFLHSQGSRMPWFSISPVIQLRSCPWSLGDIPNPCLLSFFFCNKPALSGLWATQRKLEENFVCILSKLVCLCLWCFYLEQICFFNLNKVKSNSHFLYSFCCCFYPSTSHICTSRLQKYSPVFLLLFCSVFLYYFPCIFSVVLIWFYFFTLKFQISLWFTLVKDVWSKNGINLYLFSRVKEKKCTSLRKSSGMLFPI